MFHNHIITQQYNYKIPLKSHKTDRYHCYTNLASTNTNEAACIKWSFIFHSIILYDHFVFSIMMARRNDLTAHEKGKIIVYKKCGILERAIAEKFGSFLGVIFNFLKFNKTYGVNKPPGGFEKLTYRQKRNVVN